MSISEEAWGGGGQFEFRVFDLSGTKWRVLLKKQAPT